MPRAKNIWVIPMPDGKYAIKREGTPKPLFIVATEKEALDKAKDIAKQDGVARIVQGKDRKIASRDKF
jgi:hypothetical protein